MAKLKIHEKSQNGSVLAFVAMVGFGLAILALYISQNVKNNSYHMVYFNNMNRAYKLAESGLAIAVGQLSVNPSTGGILTGGPILTDGQYENYVEQISTPILGGYYIMTTATVTVSGKTYACALHSYAKVASISDYFAAIKNEFILSPGMDASGGKIYAPNLTFRVSTETASISRAASVEYVGLVMAKIDGDTAEYDDPSFWNSLPSFPGVPGVGGVISDYICIGTTTCTVPPVQLATPINFPLLNAADFQRYIDLATPAHSQFGMWDMRSEDCIFPPGYENPNMASCPDNYPNHVGGAGANEMHVYYSTTGFQLGKVLPLGTTIYGQVLFVTPGDIEIWGDISSTTDAFMPGAGFPSSSTAHQAILIAGGDIIIKTGPGTNLGAGSTRKIEAMFFAPNGGLTIEDDTSGGLPETLLRNFQFRGAWILGQTAPPRENLPTQFTGTRTYQYMTTLKTNPPPYLPALSEVYYSLEDITASPGVFN